MRYVTITTVRPATRSANAIDSPDGMLAVHILELNFNAFMTLFSLVSAQSKTKPLSFRIEAKLAGKLECG